MEIVRQSENLTKKDIFKMGHGNGVTSLKNVEDETIICPVGYVLYRDVNSKGEEMEILSIKAEDDTIYACQSETFKREFFAMVDEFWPDMEIIKLSGETKAGREFITCSLA